MHGIAKTLSTNRQFALSTAGPFRTAGIVTVVVLLLQLLVKHPLQADDQPGVSDGFKVESSDWPWWRGTERNGTANSQQSPPVEFGEQKNVIWQAKVPGRGHGSPIVVGNKIVLATADEETGSQSLLCFDRTHGDLLWNRILHASGAMRKNEKASAASSTPACDGQRIFINFPNSDQLITSAVDLEGQLLWQKPISKYIIHQGYGASPTLYRDLVIVTSDNKGGGAITALNRESGKLVWTHQRPQKPNYSSPTIVHVDGTDQLIMTGCDLVVSYNPLNGEINWETPGATTECVTSTLTDGKLIYTSGGYPTNHMSAIRADGSLEVVWKNDTRLYVPSLVIRDGYLYAVLDAGIAMCWEAATGKEMWKKRLGGTFSSSPVLVGDKIFVTSEAGDFFVFVANPLEYQAVAKNQLGEEVFATPTIVGSRIYHRVAIRSASGERQEVLYCLGD